jgi:hypothetical protein
MGSIARDLHCLDIKLPRSNSKCGDGGEYEVAKNAFVMEISSSIIPLSLVL